MLHAQGSHHHSGFGYCIYCGAEGDLTDEHIIPLALGGKHVIREASCKRCATLTSKFELRVARGLWGDARNVYNAPSRRKNKKQKMIPIGDKRFPKEDYPGVFVFYHMPIAGILAGLSPKADVSPFWKLMAYGDNNRWDEFERRHGFKLEASFVHYPREFGLTLLKAGYCQALTMLSPREFDPLCLRCIVGDEPNVSYLVGSTIGSGHNMKEIGSYLKTFFVGNINTIYVVSQVQIFSELGSPIYDAVVGVIKGRDVIHRVLNDHPGFIIHPLQKN